MFTLPGGAGAIFGVGSPPKSAVEGERLYLLEQKYVPLAVELARATNSGFGSDDVEVDFGGVRREQDRGAVGH